MAIVKLSDIYAINGRALPSPSQANVSISGLQKHGERTDDGLMHKETAAYKRTVALKYNALSQEEYKFILDLIITEPPTEYYMFRYLDPQKGVTTIECYSNEFSNECYSAIFYNGLWRNVTFNCVERQVIICLDFGLISAISCLTARM
jgi:hypothetical protein